MVFCVCVVLCAGGYKEQVDQRKSNVDGVAIREKARSIYDHLAEKEPSGSSPAPGFIASHGWFHRFKQRFSLHNIARTEPSVEEIIQMNEDDQAGDDADEDDDTETRPVFTIMKLRNLLREADNLTELFTDQDPIQERSIKFKRVVDEGLIPYKETLRSMEASACQKPITAFFKPSPASTPAKKHSTPATPPVTTPARQPVTPATPDNTTSSMSSVTPIHHHHQNVALMIQMIQTTQNSIRWVNSQLKLKLKLKLLSSFLFST
ncbi:hypothetical protein GWK47_014515 [Chionoecetes opilio]|uniref:HTH CENPB-type domain-containing protein n=1 Tax=Chionoecetes opilio TaxID=41210 RepID=A0A8J4XWY9_CHIOP|nr:hypothetical protein GWK47_014515 [Chionoecetes opilio]